MAVKICVLFIPILFIIFIADSIAYNRMEEVVYEETIGVASETVKATSASLDSSLDNISNVFSAISKSQAMNEYLNYYTNDQFVSDRGSTVENNLSEQLKTFMSSLPNVNGIGISLSNYRIKYVTAYKNNELTISIMDYFKQLPKRGEIQRALVDLGGKTNTYIYVYPVSTTNHEFVLFATIQSQFLDTLAASKKDSDVDYFIYSGNKCIYSTTNDPKEQEGPNAINKKYEFTDLDSAVTEDYDSRTLIVSKLKNVPWTIVALPLLKYPKEALSKAYKISLVSRIVCCVITIGIFILIITTFVGQLRSINNTIEKVEAGDRTAVFRTEYTNELGQLGAQIDKMITQIRKQEQEIDKKEIEVQNSRLKALQNQINPHFLYNALEHIRMQAIAQNSPDLADQVHTLGELLRYNIHNEFIYVTVGQEYEQVLRYLNMQQHILGDKLTVIHDVDSSVKDCKVIKFLLQPLIENSIIHGISPSLVPSELFISIKDDGDYIDFEISDTGIGMDENKLKNLKAAFLSESQQAEGSVGLTNVNERLKLFYGSDSCLNIQSTLGQGTQITFRVPVIRTAANMTEVTHE